MNTATKTGIDAAKATGDLIGNKIADKITSIGKPKEKETKRNLYSTRKKTTYYWWLEIILNAILLNEILLNAIPLNAILLNAILLNINFIFFV